jgi:MFS family permease
MILYIPFLDNANRLFQKRFCFTQVSAGTVVMITYLVTTVVSIPLGLLVDTFGRRRLFMTAGMFIFLLAQFIILVYPQCANEI